MPRRSDRTDPRIRCPKLIHDEDVDRLLAYITLPQKQPWIRWLPIVRPFLKAARGIPLLAGDHLVSSSSRLAALSEVIVGPGDLSKEKLVDES